MRRAADQRNDLSGNQFHATPSGADVRPALGLNPDNTLTQLLCTAAAWPGRNIIWPYIKAGAVQQRSVALQELQSSEKQKIQLRFEASTS